ncbi:retropepsin-like aspartic protease [Flavobacterium sp. H122]|uniref:retropepsin-like aspartic protease n=1 Tax=Flavobacterium sp. H122 TaxID=2529860 RepID=UPI0010AAC112|nr:retropepsin-like aspartic protease [Flavobacterium sp. H122]
MKKIYLLIFLLFQFSYSFSQEGFKFGDNKKKITIPFKMSNNLVVASLKINGVDLNFLIDTGVENTILFSLEDAETVDFKNVEKIKIRGLGSGDAINAFKSSKNTIALKEYTDTNHEIYIILDQDINFSAQLGIPVHGILGYHFFKNHLVEINPISKKIIVYKDAKTFNKKKLKKYEELPISIELEKPYINAKVKINNRETIVKLLVDTGGSDALWLFENDTTIKCPADFFDDFLGRGFSGDIFGKRSRIEKFSIANIDLENPTVSFPSANSVKSVELVEGRNGSLGSGIMKRFDVVFDYPNSKLYLKKKQKF